MNLEQAWERIARALPGYERRPPQEGLAQAIWSSIEKGNHLVAEAGTGVGKSFAYLVPAMILSTRMREKVVVATRTIALQEQVLRDIPVLQDALDLHDCSVALSKGMGNYACLRRCVEADQAGAVQFSQDKDWIDFCRILETVNGDADDGETRSRSDLGFAPTWGAWAAAQAEQGNCEKHACKFASTCGYLRAKARVADADVIVTNHTLVALDMSIRARMTHDDGDTSDMTEEDTHRGVLPPHRALVLDEAHEFAGAVRSAFEDKVTPFTVSRAISRIWNPKRGTGILAKAHPTMEVLNAVDNARAAADEFFANVSAHIPPFVRQGVIDEPDSIRNPLSERLRDLDVRLRRMNHGGKEMSARREELRDLADRIEAIVGMETRGQAYWIERDEKGDAHLARSPVEVDDLLDEQMWGVVPSVICTSATLRVGGSFSHFRRETGMRSGGEMAAGSPFDFQSLARLRLYPSMPDPRADGFREAAIDRIEELVHESKGGAFVLFTSNAEMRAAHEALERGFRDAGYLPMMQGDRPNEDVVRTFRENRNCVLFAVATFWQGVDVRGENLRMVIICKLPFAVPGHPLQDARERACKKRGGNPFVEISVPEVALKVVQAFGRLIRSGSDRGVVAILDPRIVTKSYGTTILKSLPACPVERL